MTEQPRASHLLHARWLDARRRSVELCAQALAAMDAAADHAAEARRLVLLADSRLGPGFPGAFEVRGVVGDRSATVAWDAGSLSGDPEVLQRIDLVVALGGVAPRPGTPVPSLGGTRGQALLAVVRSFDRICAVRLDA